MNSVVKYLLPELQPYKRVLFFLFAMGIIASGLKALTPPLVNALVDDAWRDGNRTLAMQIPVVITVIWIMSAIARYFHMYWMKYVSYLVGVSLRRRLMDKYLTLNLAFFQKYSKGSGGLISRMLNDIGLIQVELQKLADFVREPFMAVFAISYLIWVDWVLVVFVLVALPIITTISRRLAVSLRKYSRKNQEAMEDLTTTLKEALDGTRVVQSFNLEQEMRQRFDRQAENFLASSRKIVSREEAASPLSETLASIAQAALLIYVGQQVFAQNLTIGDFTGFVFAVGLLQDSVKKVQYSYIKLQQAAVALARLSEILDSTEQVPQVEYAKPFPHDWKTIEFKNVSFAFDEEVVLKNINLTIQRGELIAIVGASGGGKSTLVNLLERFYDPTEGEITIGGIPIQEMDLKDLRQNIALVTQDVFLFGDSVEHNIQLGNQNRSAEEIPAAAKLANAHDFILNTPDKYNTKVGDKGSRLSGGEKQRISIARAIFKNAPILILDEATSALDTVSEQEVQKGLDKLLSGRTAFVIAHRLSTISRADRILVMNQGRIVEQGSHTQLLSQQGEYFKFHELHNTK
ncbi:MAG: ABC transporter ATP-binding protein [Pseudobdellovibrionaceae bacterium]|nr:ABC transporter ATP-binding protein [Bdellovibrionales bacterium]USN46678.1 MAG: ABC transporter ATP-binding protein [Pseudobdellovibrionaceae bacterium]